MTYQSGHTRGDDASVVKLYGDRNVKTSCNYMISYVKKTSNILDVGCGPGIITADLAAIASEGKTTGLDNNEGIVISAATSFPASAHPNLDFAVADAYELPYPDSSFDIVHAHALLIHLPRPVDALKEFQRVCKPGGVVCVRESNPSIVLSLKPDLPALRQYWERAQIAMEKMGAHKDAGRKLEQWAREAGFMTVTSSSSPQHQPSHGGRMTGSAAEEAIAYGLCTKEEMEEWRKGWEEYEATEGSEFILQTGEVVCQKAS